MKIVIHPAYHDNVTITCACGATFQAGSTMESIRVDICSNCHPLFTGTQKIIDTEGRVERFRKRYSREGEPKGRVRTKKVIQVVKRGAGKEQLEAEPANSETDLSAGDTV